MGQIKYSYCLNENNELVHISSVSAETRHSHTFYCLECGQPLIAKIGKIKVPHFVHGADTACDGESYLHKLAKRRIREKFMSAETIPTDSDKVYDVVEQMPQFPGGPSALMHFLSSNVKYPIKAEKKGIQGRVTVEFIVECDGSISNTKVVSGVDSSLDQEAIRVVSSMPRWIPGRQKGNPVRVKYTSPITFRLQ